MRHIDPHWFRRSFKAFGTSFLFFYLIPDDPNYLWLRQAVLIAGFGVLMLFLVIEILRIKGILSSDAFFVLRTYERTRPAGYLFFGLGALLLIAFFPQQIVVPCVLCASLGDAIIGEVRIRTKRTEYVAIVGFVACALFFLLAQCPPVIIIIGALFAVMGELIKSPWIDDDFVVQILPAVVLILVAAFGLWAPEQIISAYPSPEWLPAGRLW